MSRTAILFALFLVPTALIHAQEQSVNPGINKPYEHPDVPDSIQRFESNGRDVFDHRNEIVAAVGLKPGMAVADVGAGTGLFTRLFSAEVGATRQGLRGGHCEGVHRAHRKSCSRSKDGQHCRHRLQAGLGGASTRVGRFGFHLRHVPSLRVSHKGPCNRFTGHSSPRGKLC